MACPGSFLGLLFRRLRSEDILLIRNPIIRPTRTLPRIDNKIAEPPI